MKYLCTQKINNECKNKLRVKDNIILVKTKELQDLKVKYEEAIERNNKLQGEVIEGQKLVLEGLKNIKAAGIDKEPEMKIGFIDEEKGQVYMGYDKWITTNFYHKLMALPKIQLFVENVARFVFGDEVLLKAPSAVSSNIISEIQCNTIKTKTEKAVKEPTPPLRSNHDSEDEGEIQINNGVDGEMDDLNEEPDSEDSTAFIIDES
ncbi:uncharacterized protein LOC141535401 [Cotesia typhae]|uniref:uncharacterized protein LOC141535401 n=1 Tax=Cotesia typhae TaxID=2053667 RepID=UPI003D68B8C0